MFLCYRGFFVTSVGAHTHTGDCVLSEGSPLSSPELIKHGSICHFLLLALSYVILLLTLSPGLSLSLSLFLSLHPSLSLTSGSEGVCCLLWGEPLVSDVWGWTPPSANHTPTGAVCV